MKLLSQSFLYDDPWSIVSLAFFLRYPNPYASHVTSCDVISRTFSPNGSLITTRLILKRGSLPRWAPKGIISKSESWIIEESEVDPRGKFVRCVTKNLDHVKIMRVEESTILQQAEDNKTLQTTQARFISSFGWGLTKHIESHGLQHFKNSLQRSRAGVSLVLGLIRQSRMQPMTLGGSGPSHQTFAGSEAISRDLETHAFCKDEGLKQSSQRQNFGGAWTKFTSWFRSR